MALIEKTYSGTLTRLVAAFVAVLLALWLAAFAAQPENWYGSVWLLAPALSVFFAALGWWRWRPVADVAVFGLPLFILLPLRLGVRNYSLVELALFAAAVGGALRVVRTGRFRWFVTPLTPWLALLALAALLSGAVYFLRVYDVFHPLFGRVLLGQLAGVFQLPRESSFHPLRAALTLIEGFVFFHVIVARVREFREVRHFVQVSLLAAVIVSLFGIGQYFTNWNRVDFTPWGERINATFPDVNSLGSFLVASLFLLLPLLTVWRRWRPRGMAWWVAPLLLASLWMAHSRIALAALLLVFPAYLYLSFARHAPLEKPVVWLHRKRGLLAAAYVLALLALGFVFLGLDWQAHTDLAWTRSTGWLAQALKGRLNIWRSACYNIAEQPWFGGGIGTFWNFIGRHREPFVGGGEWNWNPAQENAHNYFLQVLAEMGVLGLGLYLFILGLLLYQGLRAVLMSRDEERSVFAGVLCGLAAFLLTCLTGHPQLIVDVNLWFWFVAALLYLPHPNESPEFAAARAGARGGRRFVLALIVLVAAGCAAGALKPHPTWFYGLGIHEQEQEGKGANVYAFRWLEKRAVCRLFQANAELAFSLRNTLGEQQPIAVEIRLNGRKLERVLLADRRWRLCSYPLPETRGKTVELELLSDYSWIPPGELRELAVQIQSLLENSWETL